MNTIRRLLASNKSSKDKKKKSIFQRSKSSGDLFSERPNKLPLSTRQTNTRSSSQRSLELPLRKIGMLRDNKAQYNTENGTTIKRGFKTLPRDLQQTLPVPASGTRMVGIGALALNTGNIVPAIGLGVGKSSEDLSIPQSPTACLNEADEYIQQAIQFHEQNQLDKATYFFKLAAERKSPLGYFLYGIALRHGWGCEANPTVAVKYLQKAAESAVDELQSSVIANPSIARNELVLAIHELGVCFRHGWGVPKNKQTAAYYFEMAASLGDPDAQNEIGFCYANGEGVKKNLTKAARYYRLASEQGASIMGNSWIYKKKYDEEASKN
ncbi:1074_t:CDS:2 [Paraglomus brasilianum]|uniref:1074_t:CDS:1 n=1 Tax=Paraglomus brasilianum TaxID=144538 RepID=A0A9N9FBN7_9GLOM|nr:1074_t:CDS:2 [Paraglomus brasilianum]